MGTRVWLSSSIPVQRHIFSGLSLDKEKKSVATQIYIVICNMKNTYTDRRYGHKNQQRMMAVNFTPQYCLQWHFFVVSVH